MPAATAPDLIGLALASRLTPTLTAPPWAALSPQPSVARGRYQMVSTGTFIVQAHGRTTAGTNVNSVERYDPATKTWANLPPGGQAYGNRYTAWAGGRLHLFGGDDSSTGFGPAHDVFTPTSSDLLSGTWSSGTALPAAPYNYGATVTIGDTVYLLGGSDAASPSNAYATLRSFPGASPTGAFTTLAPCPTPGFSGTAAAIGTKIYYWPGLTSGGAQTTNAHVYDTVTNTWSSIAGVRFVNGAAVAVGSQVWLIGPNGTLIYDTTTDRYLVAPTQVGDSFGQSWGAVFLGGLIYSPTSLGGAVVRTTDPVKALDLATPGWTVSATNAVTRWNAAASSDGTYVYVTQGMNANAHLSDGLVLNGQTGAPVATVRASPDGNNRSGVAGTFCNGRHYAIGGTNPPGGNVFATVFALRPWPASQGSTAGVAEWDAALPLLPSARCYALAAAIGSTLYVVGGRTAPTSGVTGTVWSCDTAAATPAWTTQASVPGFNADSSTAALTAWGGKLYLFVSATGGGMTVIVYDPTANTWTTGPTLTQVQPNGGGAVTIGDAIYVGNSGDSVALFRPRTNTFDPWGVTPLTVTPATRGQGTTAVAVGSRLMYLGGAGTTAIQVLETNPATPLSRRQKLVQQYLSATNPVAAAAARRLPASGVPSLGATATFSQSDARSEGAVSSDGLRYIYTGGYYYSGSVQMPTDGFTVTPAGVKTTITATDPAGGRARPSAQFLGGVHYAMGGLPSSAYTGGVQSAISTVTAYTPSSTNNGASGSWTTKAGLPAVRAYHASAALGGFLYVAGGYSGQDQSANPQSNFWRYDPVGNAWTTLASLPVPRSGGLLVPYAGKLYYVPQQVSTAIYVYDPAGNSWALATFLTPTTGGASETSTFAIGSQVYRATSGGVGVFDLATGLETTYAGAAIGNWSAVITGTTVANYQGGSGSIRDVGAAAAYLAVIAQTKALAALAA